MWFEQKFLYALFIGYHVSLKSWQGLLDAYDVSQALFEEKLGVFIVHEYPFVGNRWYNGRVAITVEIAGVMFNFMELVLNLLQLFSQI